MKKIDFKKFKSLQNFKSEIESTHLLIHALEIQISSTKQLLEFTKAKSSPDYHKFEKYLDISDVQINKLYELGYVAFFANFECFMFEFLKDLHKKYPKSFRSEKSVKFEDIKDFENIQEVKEYFIDLIAIDKSYDIETWSNFLVQKFGIKVFKTSKSLTQFKALNSLRNIILHSGSKTNSKFRNEMRFFIKSPVPLGETFDLDRKKYFSILYNFLKHLTLNLEK